MKGKGHRLWRAVWKKPLVAFVQWFRVGKVCPCPAADLVAALWAALGRLLSQGLSQKDPKGGNTEEGDKERKGVHCGEGITQTNCFSSNNNLLKLTNNEPGPFAIHFADEKTKPQESECHVQGSQLVGG